MSTFSEISQALDLICYSANEGDENNDLITFKINRHDLTDFELSQIKDSIQDFLNLFDFDDNIEEYLRTLLIEGQICWENIIAKDELDQGIVGINLIPNDSYEFAYDVKNRSKMGIMITNTAAESFNIGGFGASTFVNPAVNGTNLNCYQDLANNECIVLPWEQLTYIDSGNYSFDGKVVYSLLEKAKRPFNQLKLIEDAILIYRVARSSEKYVFNVDIGKMGRARGEQEIAKLKNQFGTKKVYDSSTGTIGKVYDSMQISENFWFCKGADSQGITVAPLQASAQWGNLDDLNYFIKKLFRSMNIPIARFFPDEAALIKNGNSDNISAEEMSFAKYVISIQKKFAYALKKSILVHLKYTGLSKVFNLKEKDISISFNPPIEYLNARRKIHIESKIEMLKLVLGDEQVSKIFSVEMALEKFMGWDKEQIERNKKMRQNEMIEQAKNDAQITAITEGDKDEGEDENSFAAVMQKGLKLSDEDEEKKEGGEESSDNETSTEEENISSKEETGDEEESS